MKKEDQGLWAGILEWMVNPELKQNNIDFARAKLIISVVIVSEVLSLTLSGWRFSAGEFSTPAVILLAGILVITIPFILRKVTSFVIPGLALCILIYMAITFVVISTGGIQNSGAVFYIMVILLAFIIIGIAAGLFFCVLSAITLVTAYTLQANGTITRSIPETPIETVVIYTVGILILTALFFVYSRMNQNFQKQLEDTAEKISRNEKSKAQTLQDTSEIMTLLAKGNLSKRITSDFAGFEKLKVTVNKALEMLSQTISRLIIVSDQVSSGANELSRGSQSLASGTTEQAASLEEISSSMDEISAQAKINDENSSQARALSSQTTKGVMNGNKQMQLMVNSMEKISSTSSEVSKVIKVIDEIAFQTNLLALNAAVEAARAGKYGKGFAVVAEEVRNLASRSAEAAKSTTELIENSIKEIATGVENATKTAEVLSGIKGDIDKVNDFIGEIAAASQEQVASVNEINSSLVHVNDVIQQNSSISEESASASTELSKQAAELQRMVQEFKLTDQQVNRVQPVGEMPRQSSPISATQQLDLKKTVPPRKAIVLDE